MTDTKYGDMIPDDHDWTDSEHQPENHDRTSISDHEIEAIYVTDPQEKHGYGRERYDAIIRYDDESGEPYVLYVVEYRWKGNYWRDVTDWDWRDIPEPVREQVAAVLPVTGPDDLTDEARLIEEGGESRWQKHHKHRLEELSADEMWGTSFLRDALEDLETAAEAFEDGSKGEELTERLRETTQKIIQTVNES